MAFFNIHNLRNLVRKQVHGNSKPKEVTLTFTEDVNSLALL